MKRKPSRQEEERLWREIDAEVAKLQKRLFSNLSEGRKSVTKKLSPLILIGVFLSILVWYHLWGRVMDERWRKQEAWRETKAMEIGDDPCYRQYNNDPNPKGCGDGDATR